MSEQVPANVKHQILHNFSDNNNNNKINIKDFNRPMRLLIDIP